MSRTIYCVIVDCPIEDSQLASDLASAGASAVADYNGAREVQLLTIKPPDASYSFRPRVRMEESRDA